MEEPKIHNPFWKDRQKESRDYKKGKHGKLVWLSDKLNPRTYIRKEDGEIGSR